VGCDLRGSGGVASHPSDAPRRVLDRLGVTAMLERAGVKPPDVVRCGKRELLWE